MGNNCCAQKSGERSGKKPPVKIIEDRFNEYGQPVHRPRGEPFT